VAQSRDLPPPRQEVRALRWLASQIASGRAGPCCLANSGRRLASEHRHYKQPSRFAVKPELGFALKTLGLCNASGRSNRYACGPASCRRWAAAYRCIGNDLLADAVVGMGPIGPWIRHALARRRARGFMRIPLLFPSHTSSNVHGQAVVLRNAQTGCHRSARRMGAWPIHHAAVWKLQCAGPAGGTQGAGARLANGVGWSGSGMGWCQRVEDVSEG